MPYFGRAPTGTGAANKIEGDLKGYWNYFC